MTHKVWQASVFALVIVRIVMWVLLQHDIPKLIDHYQWQFYHGGDEVLFFNVAQQLLTGRYSGTTVGVGLPLMLAGFLALVDGETFQDIVPLVVISNGLWMAVLSVPVMARLGRALTGSRAQSIWVAALWTLLPYVLWLGFGVHPEREVLRNAYVARQMWVAGITDGPALFLVMLGLVFVFRGRSAHDARVQIAYWLAGGLSLGLAAAVRIHVLPVVGVILAAVILWRHWRGLLWLALGVLIGFGPQFWHNGVANGHPLNTPYVSNWLHFSAEGALVFQLNNTPISPGFLAENVVTLATRRPVLVAAALGVLLLGVYAAWHSRARRGGALTLMMFGMPLASFGLHVVTYIYMTDPIRFTLPAVAFGLPALVWTGGLILDKIGRRWRPAVRVALI